MNQTVVLFNVALWTFLLSRERLGVSAWIRALSLWTLLTTLSLHRLGASFVRTSLLEHGRHGASRRIVSLAIGLGVVLTLVWAVADALPALRASWHVGLRAWLAALGDAAEGPIAGHRARALSPGRAAPGRAHRRGVAPRDRAGRAAAGRPLRLGAPGRCRVRGERGGIRIRAGASPGGSAAARRRRRAACGCPRPGWLPPVRRRPPSPGRTPSPRSAHRGPDWC